MDIPIPHYTNTDHPRDHSLCLVVTDDLRPVCAVWDEYTLFFDVYYSELVIPLW